MKIIKLDQHCTLEHQGDYGWEPSTIYEPIYIVAEHIESMFYTGNTNLKMISGDTIKVKETPEQILKQLEMQVQETVTTPDEPAGSAMHDLFYQTEHPVCSGNVQLARSEARSLASWITANLNLRRGAAK